MVQRIQNMARSPWPAGWWILPSVAMGAMFWVWLFRVIGGAWGV